MAAADPTALLAAVWQEAKGPLQKATAAAGAFKNITAAANGCAAVCVVREEPTAP